MSRAEAEGPGPEIGQAIKRRRRQMGITGRQLAERSGVSRSAISQLEGGKSKHPWVEVIGKLAKALRTTTDDLLREAGVEVSPDVAPDINRLYELLDQQEREAWMKMGEAIRDLREAWQAAVQPPLEDDEEWEPTLVEPVAAESGEYAPDRRRIAERREDYRRGHAQKD